ncbi:hypothetical protein [Leptospira alexanderi]|uniref:PF09926 repeat protein n=1 Tax=Leptospira alexanderi serovar Manhao 3 str. L 60 TaxID=1049759 RepID=V6I9D9_9LEPT|nr:hypothetical protein [Leptospira alexanderi]EQA64189.1 hypothetical protein LEP1GSC062_2033 [Leptospira alexanderi serovar Manhao 3 str. L 60]
MEVEETKRKQGYVLGEAVRDKRTGQKMYVDATWSLEIKCVYYDPVTDKLVKLEVPYEALEKVEERRKVRTEFRNEVSD